MDAAAHRALAAPDSSEGAQGSLRSGLQARRLAWEREGLKIEADDVQLEWRPLFLLDGIIKLDHVRAAALRITDRRPPAPEPWKLPDSLVMRPDIELDDLAIGRVDWITAHTVTAERIAGRYWFDGAAHTLRLDNVRWAGGTYRGTARLGALAPLPLSATVSAKLDAPVPGTDSEAAAGGHREDRRAAGRPAGASRGAHHRRRHRRRPRPRPLHASRRGPHSRCRRRAPT